MVEKLCRPKADVVQRRGMIDTQMGFFVFRTGRVLRTASDVPSGMRQVA